MKTQLKENLEAIAAELAPSSCKLVAVSKTKPVETLQEAYGCGQRIFGENKAQEMAAKYEQLPKDIQWHMIGHLQTNKVKYIAPFVSMIHSVDSLKVLKEIDKRARNAERVIDCLFQIHIAEEESKFGLSESELYDILNGEAFASMQNVMMRGLMGMATNTDNEKQITKEFTYLRGLFDRVKSTFGNQDNLDFAELSIGMSGDYKIALSCGSTLVRIGSSIFGARNYD